MIDQQPLSSRPKPITLGCCAALYLGSLLMPNYVFADESPSVSNTQILDKERLQKKTQIVQLTPNTPVLSTEDPIPTEQFKSDSSKTLVQAHQSPLTVEINSQLMVQLPKKSKTILLGSEGVADLKLLENGIGVIIGKSYGSSRITIFDASGKLIYKRTILVVAAKDMPTITVQKGEDLIQTYSCTPECHLINPSQTRNQN